MPPVETTPRCLHRVPGRNEMLVDVIARMSFTPPETLAELHCPDVHLLARTLARAAVAARTDRALFEVPADGWNRTARYTRSSAVLAGALAVATIATLVGFALFIGALL